MIAAFDRLDVTKVFEKSPEGLDREEQLEWYGERFLMTLASPLCFGTHIFVFILSALVNRPEYFFYLVVLLGNLYLLLVAVIRNLRVARARGRAS